MFIFSLKSDFMFAVVVFLTSCSISPERTMDTIGCAHSTAFRGVDIVV